MQPRRSNQNRNRGNNRNNSRGRNNRNNNRGKINVKQCMDKRDSFLNKARDAQMGGDRAEAEYFLQHADHYQRLINEYNSELEAKQMREAQEAANMQESGNAENSDAANTETENAQGNSENTETDENNSTNGKSSCDIQNSSEVVPGTNLSDETNGKTGDITSKNKKRRSRKSSQLVDNPHDMLSEQDITETPVKSAKNDNSDKSESDSDGRAKTMKQKAKSEGSSTRSRRKAKNDISTKDASTNDAQKDEVTNKQHNSKSETTPSIASSLPPAIVIEPQKAQND